MLLDKIWLYIGCFVCYLLLWSIIVVTIVFDDNKHYLLFSFGWGIALCSLAKMIQNFDTIKGYRLIYCIILVLGIFSLTENTDVELNSLGIENINLVKWNTENTLNPEYYPTNRSKKINKSHNKIIHMSYHHVDDEQNNYTIVDENNQKKNMEKRYTEDQHTVHVHLDKVQQDFLYYVPFDISFSDNVTSWFSILWLFLISISLYVYVKPSHFWNVVLKRTRILFNCDCCYSSSYPTKAHDSNTQEFLDVINSSIFSKFDLGIPKLMEKLTKVNINHSSSRNSKNIHNLSLKGSIDSIIDFQIPEQHRKKELKKVLNDSLLFTSKYNQLYYFLHEFGIVRQMYNTYFSIFGDNFKFVGKVIHVLNSDSSVTSLFGKECIDLSLLGIYMNAFGNDSFDDSKPNSNKKSGRLLSNTYDGSSVDLRGNSLEYYERLFLQNAKANLKQKIYALGTKSNESVSFHSGLEQRKEHIGKLISFSDANCLFDIDFIYQFSYTLWIAFLLVAISAFVFIGNQIPKDLSYDLNLVSCILRSHIIFTIWFLYILNDSCLYSSQLLRALLEIHKLRLKIRNILHFEKYNINPDSHISDNEGSFLQNEINYYNEGNYDSHIYFNLKRFILLFPLFFFPLFLKSMALVFFIFLITIVIQLTILIVQIKLSLGRIEYENYIEFVKIVVKQQHNLVMGNCVASKVQQKTKKKKNDKKNTTNCDKIKIKMGATIDVNDLFEEKGKGKGKEGDDDNDDDDDEAQKKIIVDYTEATNTASDSQINISDSEDSIGIVSPYESDDEKGNVGNEEKTEGNS